MFTILLRLPAGARTVLEMLMYPHVHCAFSAPPRATWLRSRQTVSKF